MKFPGGPHRVLADHGIGDKKNFAGLQFFFQHAQLVHQFIIDVQAAGRIHQDHVTGGKLRFLDCPPDDFQRLVRPCSGPDRRADSLRDLRKLFARCRTVYVRGNDQRTMPMLRKPFGELPRRRGLAGTLQPHNHPHRWRARSKQRLGVLAQHRRKLVAHHFDDLLIRRKLQHHFAADRFRADVG